MARIVGPAPKELPDLRLHLMERWAPGGLFARAVPRAAEQSREALRRASLWWVRSEMVDLIASASRTMPDDLVGKELHMPADQEYGMVVLQKPFMGHDAVVMPGDEPGQTQTDLIVWHPAMVAMGSGYTKCVSVQMYRWFDLEGGLSPVELAVAVRTGAFESTQGEWKHQADGTVTLQARGGAWVYQGRMDWPLVDPIIEVSQLDNNTPFEDGTDATLSNLEARRQSMIEDRRFFAALCVLVEHKLSQTDTDYPQRHVYKRAAKAGITEPKETSKVRIIRLREVPRQKGETAEDYEKRKVEWSHRWIVGAHMAWRHVGPRGSNRRRRVYISPYVKGPADAPLVLKEDVRVWVR
jgi:hypothetical protein